MSAVALALVALCQLGLLIVSLRTLVRHRTWDFAVPVAVTAALVYDNSVLALGRAIGEGDVLRLLSVPRYAGHAVFTPMLVLFAFTCAGRFGIARYSRREAATGWGAVVFLAIVYGVFEGLIELELAPSYKHGLLSYSNVGSSGPPIAEIVTVSCLLLIGGTIARYGRSHAMFLASLAMFVIAAFWASQPVVSNVGELILLTGIVVTGLRGISVETERKQARKAAARSHQGVALLGPSGRVADAERKRRTTRWNRYLGVLLAIAFPLSYLVARASDEVTGTMDTWVSTADVLVQGLSTALLIGHAVYSFSVFGFPDPRWNLRTVNGYISYAVLFTFLLSQAATGHDPIHTILHLTSLGLIVVHVGIAVVMRRRRPPSGTTFGADLRTVVAADASEVARVRAALDHDQPSPVVLTARRVSVALGGLGVLEDVDVEVRRGEVVALVGNNGAGKTTLLRTLSGLQQPSRGRVELDGVDVTGASAAARARLGVTLVVGGHAVFGSLSVEDNLRLFASRLELDAAALQSELTAVYAEFPWLADRSQQLASTLSGGQHQMLAVAQGLIGRPEVLVIDEFSLGLSPVVVDQLAAMVRVIVERGTAVLLVEQSVDLALELADRVYVLDRGRIALSATTAELRTDPERLTSVLMHAPTTSGV